MILRSRHTLGTALAGLLCFGLASGEAQADTTRTERIKRTDPSRTASQLSLVVVGDVMLNRSNLQVDPKGVLEGASVLPWKELSSGIAPLIDGDLNFMNLETVVTDRNDLAPGNKRQKTPFLFRTHPIGVAHLLDLGFNLVSAANNHAYDYGEAGARETVAHLDRLTASRPGTVFAGIGLDDDQAARPATLLKRGVEVAFSSIGIVTNHLTFHRAGPGKAGTLGFRFEEDWQRSVDELVESDAELKLLSVHYGREKDIRTDDTQRSQWRDAIDRGVDAVIGHHAHVVRGIELHNGKPIFYGLGNFLIRGAANMGKRSEFNTCCDYGLLAKVHFARSGKDMEAVAIEAVPVFDMHRIAHPLDAAEAARRIEVLNVMAEALDQPATGSVGVRFQVRADGTGLYCSPKAATLGGRAGKLCKDYEGPTEASAEVRSRVARAPDPSTLKKKKSKKKRRRNRKRRRRGRR